VVFSYWEGRGRRLTAIVVEAQGTEGGEGLGS
jgi:hypothetical protein